MSTPEHIHEWKLLTHIDSCHWFSSHYGCPCGFTRTMWAERQAGDSIFWNESGDCERCAEIEAGADPDWQDEIKPPA